MIAAATMYEVRTQVIWSWAAPRLPCMLGRATLAMVVSSTCITVASMIETVISPLCGTGAVRASVIAQRAWRRLCGGRGAGVEAAAVPRADCATPTAPSPS